MKLHTERNDIERSGVGTETEFKIKTTAKAFDILSSGLYTDNILAVVRELACNAYDAHVAAGKKDVPFEVHIPNRIEPFFSVKDYGVGLSDEQVMSLYTTYFDSTKTDSNEFIGALGLGSKSPFSYVKAFEVIARFDGMRRVYSVFINEDGVPTIARLGEPLATDEPNGLEVKMTVDPNDFYRFSSKAAHALRWFPVKPKILGEANFRFEEPPATDMQGDSWYIYKGYGSGRMSAVQGNVEYRVDINQIEELDDSIRAFLRTVNVIGFFEIGELEVAASREEIRYDKRTKEALAKKVASIHEAALKSIEAKADKLTGSLWDAIIELDKLSESMFRSSSELRGFVKNSEHPVLKAYAESQGRVKLHEASAHEVIVYTWSRYGRNLKRNTPTGGFNPKEETVFFINDVKTGGVSRLANWMRNNDKRSAIVLVEKAEPFRYEEVTGKDGKKDMVKHPMSAKEVKAEYKKLIDGFGNPEIKVISQDTVAVRRESKTRMKAIFTYSDYNSNTYREDTVVWNREEEVDMAAGGVYFMLERGSRIKWRGEKIEWAASEVFHRMEQIIDVINHYLELDEEDQYDAETVLGVGSLDIKKFEQADNWFNMFDLLEQAIPSYAEAVEAHARWNATPDLHGLKSVFKHSSFTPHVNKLDPKSPFRQVVDTLTEAAKDLQECDLPHIHAVRDFDRVYGKSVISAVDVQGHISEDALEMYPMLKFVKTINLHSYEPTDLNTLFNYINSIDGSN